jgi:threonine-phosphate decarboxylase
MNFLDLQITGAVHGGRVFEAARAWGISPSEVLDFSANINPSGPPPGVIEALANACFRHYPDERPLLDAIARKYDLDPECIIVGNGSAGLLFDAVRALKPRHALLLEPAFGEYRRALRSVQSEIDEFRLCESSGFMPDFPSIQKRLLEKEIDFIILNTPHNPTGLTYDVNDLRKFLTFAGSRGIRVLVDEAFADYAPRASCLAFSKGLHNVLILRSLTKFYAIPGIRIGFAVGNPSMVETIRPHRAPWTVGAHAIAAAIAALGDDDFDQRTRRQNIAARSVFIGELTRLGFRVFPSNTNFLGTVNKHPS